MQHACARIILIATLLVGSLGMAVAGSNKARLG